MTRTPNLVRRLAAPLAVLALAAGTAQAAPLEFRFSADGFALPSDCGTGCVQVGTVALADDLPGSNTPIPDEWALFTNFTVQTATGHFTGTWSLTDQGIGGNDLSGTLSGTVTPLFSTLTSARIDYVITGGAGLFNGATGLGASVAFGDAATLDYRETGAFSVSTPVPEPSTWAMLLLGVAGVGVASRRRGA